jgi:hypothetical protein
VFCVFSGLKNNIVQRTNIQFQTPKSHLFRSCLPHRYRHWRRCSAARHCPALFHSFNRFLHRNGFFVGWFCAKKFAGSKKRIRNTRDDFSVTILEMDWVSVCGFRYSLIINMGYAHKHLKY